MNTIRSLHLFSLSAIIDEFISLYLRADYLLRVNLTFVRKYVYDFIVIYIKRDPGDLALENFNLKRLLVD